jgi:hypothetical protein
LGRVITGDETWVYQYDPETKRQSAHWKTAVPHEKKIRQSKSRVKAMLVTFFILKGLFIKNLYQMDKVNQFYYLEVLERLREIFRRKRPEIFASNSWILHHDNASAHTAL